jgi:hypothetical protein
MSTFFNSRVAASALYRIVTVGTGCATLATYIADNVDGVDTTMTVGIVCVAVMLGMLMFIVVSDLQGETFLFKRCSTCDSVQKKVPAWIKGTVSAKALTMLRMEVVIFSTYFALSYADSVYVASRESCSGSSATRATAIGTMLLGCFVAAACSLFVSSVLLKRTGTNCCSECTLNDSNSFVTTRLKN